MKSAIENKLSESEQENVVIWQIQFDHNMFRLCNNEIDFVSVQNLYTFLSILFCDNCFYKDVDIFFRAWH